MPAFIDLTGQRFNMLTVIERAGRNENSQIMWRCRCDCGAMTVVRGHRLRTGHTKSCGCLTHRFRDVTGERFGRLVAVRRAGVHNEASMWLCRCDCGNEKVVGLRCLSDALLGKGTRSCGCLHRESAVERSTTHGATGTPEHRAWQAMIQRCTNRNLGTYPGYGGRGITVCERWRASFENFIADMGPKPSPRHSLDRIDNDAGYEPSNCRWALPAVQARNTRRAAFVTIRGDRFNLIDAAAEFGINASTLRARLRRGIDPETAATAAVAPRRRRPPPPPPAGPTPMSSGDWLW